MKLRVLKPSVGAPKKVAALVSAAMIDANTATRGSNVHRGRNSLRVRLRPSGPKTNPNDTEKIEAEDDQIDQQRAKIGAGKLACSLTRLRRMEGSQNAFRPKAQE